MKRSYAGFTLAGLFIVAALVALTSRPVASADDEIISSDKTVTSDLSNGNQQAAEKLLDADLAGSIPKG